MLVELIGFFPFVILFVFYLFVKFRPQKMHGLTDREDEGNVLLPMSGDRLSTGKKIPRDVLIEKDRSRSAE